MIKGKKPTRLQKNLLKKAGLDPMEWLVIKIMKDEILFRNREDAGKTKLLKI